MSATAEHTPREKVIRAATIAIFVAALGFVAYGVIGARAADNQAGDVRAELVELYAPGGDRPDPDEVFGALTFSQDVPEPDFPAPEGVRLRAYRLLEGTRTVNLSWQGDGRAVGWCFRVHYAGQEEPSVETARCSS